MRPTERIDNFLNLVDWGIIADRWKLTPADYLNVIKEIDNIKELWLANPDQRIGQLLINNGIISDNFMVWNDEEFDILMAQEVPPEDCLYWGSIYDKDMNPIPLTYKLIKDLDSEHITAIFQHQFKYGKELNYHYRAAFKNTLAKRPGEEYQIELIKLIEDFWDLPKITESELICGEKTESYS